MKKKNKKLNDDDIFSMISTYIKNEDLYYIDNVIKNTDEYNKAYNENHIFRHCVDVLRYNEISIDIMLDIVYKLSLINKKSIEMLGVKNDKKTKEQST